MCALSCSVISDSLWSYQAPLSMVFSWQECWSALPFPPLGDLPNPGIEPASPVSPALAGIFFTTEPPGTPFSQAYRKLKIGLIFKICNYMCGHSQTCLTTQDFSQGSRHTVREHFLGPWLSRKATYKQETKCGWGKSGNKMWKSLGFWSCVQLGNFWQQD